MVLRSRLRAGCIIDYIKKSNLIYFVPHQILHYLPLHVLSVGKEPIITSKPVTYLPSASLLPFFKNKGSNAGASISHSHMQLISYNLKPVTIRRIEKASLLGVLK